MPAVRVSVELLPAVTLVGENDAVAPGGRSNAVSCTDSADPALNVVAIVVVWPCPCSAVTPFGAPNVKSFCAQFGNLNDWMDVSHPPNPADFSTSFAYQNVQSSVGSMVMLE